VGLLPGLLPVGGCHGHLIDHISGIQFSWNIKIVGTTLDPKKIYELIGKQPYMSVKRN
jgi:hypothetical protein